MSDRRPPHDCPVCGETLALTRLSCRACGTELSGDFQSCEFCALSGDERELLRVFLASRGNMRELQNFLNVSYPTARLRFDALLGKLGLDKGAASPPPPSADRVEILQALARGDIDLGEAEQRLQR
ncbi:MAG TPA: DUF2089 domain-containing protein [Actinomycetes bacterium]|jgi:hypothetical protein|nr:DUF2089 domain-containing protein [Actinomycetes bacterium]